MTQPDLSAWINDTRVGRLDAQRATTMTFGYDPRWSATGFALAPPLPLERPPGQSDAEHADGVRIFFENLLPEGRALDDASRQYNVSKANAFALLYAIGRESAGALALWPGDAPPAERDGKRRAVSYAELSERIRERPYQPFTVWDRQVRLSLAGYQDKLAVVADADRHLWLVDGALCSTHILKPEPVRNPSERLVANEHFCMSLAAAVTLPVAAVDILRVPEPVLLVARFDRERSPSGTRRRHIIDACQALGMPVGLKYERPYGHQGEAALVRDGVNYPKLFSLAGKTAIPAQATLQLLRWTIFQHLIGNSDAHGKNLSFFVDRNGMRVAPAYDMVSILIYEQYEHQAAMAIGDQFDMTRTTAFDWADFAVQCRLNRQVVASEMRRLCRLVKTQTPQLAQAPLYLDDEREVVQRIARSIDTQCARLDALAAQIPKVDAALL
jgi:serine/threonine-protein kinase HipA